MKIIERINAELQLKLKARQQLYMMLSTWIFPTKVRKLRSKIQIWTFEGFTINYTFINLLSKTHPIQSIRFRKDITGCHTATPYPWKSVASVSTLSEANVNPICASSLCTTALLGAFSSKHMGWQLSFQVLALLLPPSSTHLANTLISGAKP